GTFTVRMHFTGASRDEYRLAPGSAAVTRAREVEAPVVAAIRGNEREQQIAGRGIGGKAGIGALGELGGRCGGEPVNGDRLRLLTTCHQTNNHCHYQTVSHLNLSKDYRGGAADPAGSIVIAASPRCSFYRVQRAPA